VGAAKRASTRVLILAPEHVPGEQRSPVRVLTMVSVLDEGVHLVPVSHMRKGWTSKMVIGIGSNEVTWLFGLVEGGRVV
jgi:hypothetical protein